MKNRIKKIKLFCSSFMILLEWLLLKAVRKEFSFKRMLSPQAKEIKIFGNGPSLKNEALNTKDDCDYCCVNHSLMSDFFFKIKPKYFITVDPLFVGDYLNKHNECVSRLLDVHWKMIWFVSYDSFALAKSLVKSNDNILVKWHPSGLKLGMRIDWLRNRVFKYGMAAPPVQNVLVAAIYDLLMDGYKQIELYGVEHSWLNLLSVDNENRVCLKDVHFYDNNEVQLKPWYRMDGEIYDMPTILRTLAITFEAYHDLQRFSTYLGGIEIVNMTPNSFIDAFKRGV